MTIAHDDLDMFREYHRTRERALRNRLVEAHMGLAGHLAKKFTRSGGHDDDIRQVAMVALVKAVDRFDPEYGVAFATFAGRTIEGEIKRHFRDATWAVRVPRRAKELHLLVRKATSELEHRTGRSPSVDEVAAHLGVDRDDVLRGLSATAASTVGTIDSSSDDADDRQAAIGRDDRRFDDVDDREQVTQLMEALPERDREVLRLRFVEQLSQQQIADQIGTSQMQISRILRRAFDSMRQMLDAPPEP